MSKKDKVDAVWALSFVIFFGSLFIGFSLPVKAGWQPIEIIMLTITVTSGLGLIVCNFITTKIMKKEFEEFNEYLERL